jgi:hypothetical protein
MTRERRALEAELGRPKGRAEAGGPSAVLDGRGATGPPASGRRRKTTKKKKTKKKKAATEDDTEDAAAAGSDDATVARGSLGSSAAADDARDLTAERGAGSRQGAGPGLFDDDDDYEHDDHAEA